MTGTIVTELLKLARLHLAARQESIVAGIAWVFTGAEFLTGVLLLFRKTRTVGICCAVVLHGSLLVALGPAGLGHHGGVLCWNAMFLALVPVLYREQVTDRPEHQRVNGGILTMTSLVIFGLPASGLVGIFDNWPSWQLYSSRPETLRLEVPESAIEHLPESIEEWLGPPEPFGTSRPLRIDRWSLTATGAPIYPEDRFQLAILKWVTAELPAESELRVTIERPGNVAFWKREHKTLRTVAALRSYGEHFFLNTTAVGRRNSRDR